MKNMIDSPLVSIIVRTKDRPKLLKKSLQSISAQTYRPIEIVLVNDGGCELDIEELKGILGDISLNYIRFEKNRGRAGAGNAGLENAKGKYIGFLDDDDELFPEHVATLVSFLEQSDYKVAYTDAEILYREFDPEKKKIKDVSKTVLFSKYFSYEELLVGNYIPFMCLLFSKEVFSALDASLDENFNLYEDWDLLIRIGHKYPFYHIKQVTALYNQWSRELQINQADSEIMKSMHLKVISKHSDKITPEIILNMKYKRESLESEIKHLTAKDSHVNELIREKDSLIWQMDEVIREKNKEVVDLHNVINEKDSVINKKDGDISQLIRDVKKFELALDQMKETLGWKLLDKFRKLREKLFPGNSIRRKIYEVLIKSIISFLDGIHSIVFSRFRSKKKTGFIGPHLPSKIANIEIEKSSLDPDKFKVLFLISPWAGVTNRYRAYNMKEYLELAGVESEVVSLEEIDTQPSYALEFDVAVIHRIPMNEVLDAFIKKCRELYIPVVFDLDDYIFDISLTDRIDEIKRMNIIERNKWIRHVKGCRKTLDTCDYFIGATDYLVDKVRDLGKKAFLIRNGLNKTQVAESKKAFAQVKRDPNVIKIGYFSGTRTHQKDFEVAIPALLRVMREHKNVHLCIGGFLDLNNNFDEFSERIERLPYVNWKELPYNIARIDINIVPLESDNPFCEAKSELKYFESALLKLPTIVTPTDTYRWAIRAGENGLLASTQEEWYTCLKSLIEDYSLRMALGDKAYRVVMETYTPRVQAENTLAIYQDIIKDYVKTRIPGESLKKPENISVE